MDEQQVEEFELLAMDTRKVFEYDKHHGMWAWHDRDEDPVDWHWGFATRWEALQAAVEPYVLDS
jgi:hypothetical protein